MVDAKEMMITVLIMWFMNLSRGYIAKNYFNKICKSVADTFNKFTFGNRRVSSRQLVSFI